MATDWMEQMSAIRLELERACSLLTTPSPECMESCTAALQLAAAQLAECQPGWRLQAGNPAALEEAWRLRNTFSHAGRLLGHAAEYHANWVRLRGAMAGGYLAGGEPAAVVRANRICLAG